MEEKEKQLIARLNLVQWLASSKATPLFLTYAGFSTQGPEFFPLFIPLAYQHVDLVASSSINVDEVFDVASH